MSKNLKIVTDKKDIKFDYKINFIGQKKVGETYDYTWEKFEDVYEDIVCSADIADKLLSEKRIFHYQFDSEIHEIVLHYQKIIIDGIDYDVTGWYKSPLEIPNYQNFLGIDKMLETLNLPYKVLVWQKAVFSKERKKYYPELEHIYVSNEICFPTNEKCVKNRESSYFKIGLYCFLDIYKDFNKNDLLDYFKNKKEELFFHYEKTKNFQHDILNQENIVFVAKEIFETNNLRILDEDAQAILAFDDKTEAIQYLLRKLKKDKLGCNNKNINMCYNVFREFADEKSKKKLYGNSELQEKIFGYYMFGITAAVPILLAAIWFKN